MGITNNFDLATLSGARLPYRVYVEIKSETYTDVWCDINKPVPAAAADDGFNRLVKLPSITVKSEVQPGRFASSISSLVLNDSDGYFGQEISEATPFYIYSASGVLGQITGWYHRKVKVSIGHHAESAGSWVKVTLGVFLIDELTRDSKSRTVTMKLVGLEKLLMDAKASDVKRGDAWLTNIPIPLLVNELIEKAGGGDIDFASGSPPAHCRQTTNTNEVSLLGNCPPKDGTAWMDHTEIVPRYIFSGTSGARLGEFYLCGYRKKDGRAAVARWKRTDSTDPWDVSVFSTGGVDFYGYEVVFGCQGSGSYSGSLWLFLISNESASVDPYTKSNHQMIILRVTPGATWSVDWSGAYAVWRCGMLGLQPNHPYFTNLWGHFASQVTLYNTPQFFPCRFAAAGTAMPYPVRVNSASNSDTGRMEPAPLDDVLTEANSIGSLTDVEFATLPGYYALYQAGHDQYHILRVPLHADAHESFRFLTTTNRVYWLRFVQTGATEGYWVLASMSNASATADLRVQRIRFGGGDDGTIWEQWANQPVAFDLNVSAGGSGVFNLSYVNLDGPRSGSLPTMQCTLADFSYTAYNQLASPSARTFTNNLMTPNQGRRYAPIIASIRKHQNTTALCGLVVNVFAAGGHPYGFWWHASTSRREVFINSSHATVPNMPISAAPLSISTGSRTSGSDSIWYAQDQATGTLWEFKWDGLSYFRFSPPLSVGEPVDGESTWASSNLFWDSAYTLLYGASASSSPADLRIDFKVAGGWSPAYPPLDSSAPGGRMSLWQYGANLGDIIRVADFGDASTWDALEMCREVAGDYVMGFNKSGNFVFKERQTTGDSVVEIRERGDQAILTDGTHAPADSVASRIDHKAIANNITIPTWIGERQSPAVEMILTPDSKAAGVGIAANHTGNSAQRVVLRCIRSGAPQADDTLEGRPLLFAWTRAYADLTTSLATVTPTSFSQVRVYGLHEEAGGKAYLGDAEVKAGDRLYVGDGSVREIRSIDVATGTIQLDGAVGGTASHKIGATVTIIPRANVRYADSLEGVCVVDGAFSLSGDEYATLTVDTTELLSAGMVLFRDTAYVQVIEILSGTEAFVRKSVLSTGTGQTGSFADGDVLRGAIWIERAGRNYAISNTGLSFSVAAGRSAETYFSSAFKEGDRIIITSEGLVSRKVNHAIVRSVNSASIARYGKHDYKPRVENRLLTQQRARLLLSSQMTHLAWPPHATTASGMPLLVSLQIGDLLNVRHTYLFPDETNYTVTHGLTGIAMDLDRGTAQLSLRSTASAGRVGEDVGTPAPPVPARPRYERHGGAPR